MSTSDRIALGLAGLWLGGVLVLVAVTLARVHALEARELERASELFSPSAGAGSQRLVTADLEEGDEVTFELCSTSELEPARYGGRLVAAVVRVTSEGEEDVVRSALEFATLAAARRSHAGACVDVGRGVIALPGRYVTEITWSEPLPEAGVRFRARTLARRSLAASDRNLIFALLVLVLLVSLSLYARPLADVTEERSLGRALAVTAASALTLWFFMGVLTPLLPRGAAWGLVSGLILALVELALAFALAGAMRSERLGLGRRVPEGGGRLRQLAPFVLLATAPIFGLLLFRLAQVALRLVPSTGEAPIEAFVAWPSGMLSFAALAVLAPLAEEIFFRGMVYGVLAGSTPRAGRVLAAALGSWFVFALVHLPQTWGSWGGMLSIALAALGFTVLRAVSGSVLVPAVAHLVYNGLLTAQGLLAA